ncbi:MAG: SpoIIE family protein phosphatase [Christensenellales bacterium]
MLNPVSEKKFRLTSLYSNLRGAVYDIRNATVMQASIFLCGVILARTTLFGFFAYGICFVAVLADTEDYLPAALGVALSSLLFSDFWTTAAVSVFVFWIATGKATPKFLSARSVSLIVSGILLTIIYFLKASSLFEYITYTTEIILSYAMFYVFERIYKLAPNFGFPDTGALAGEEDNQKKKNKMMRKSKNNRPVSFDIPVALSREDFICAALFICSLIIGLGRMALPFSLSLITAGFITAAVGYLAGMGAGAVAGLITGIAMAGAGAPVAAASSMGVLGLVCGIFRILKRPFMVFAFFLCSLALFFLMPSSGLFLPEICIVCASILLCPRKWYSLAAKIIQPALHRPKHSGEETGKIKKDAHVALFNVASVLEKMADTLSYSPPGRYNADTLAQQAASDVCALCPHKLPCWKNTGQRYSDMLALAQELISCGQAHLKWKCVYQQELLGALMNRLDINEGQAEEEQKRIVWRKLLQEQLMDAGNAVKELADHTTIQTNPAPQIDQQLAKSLAKMGIRIKSIDIMKPKETAACGQWEQVFVRRQLPMDDCRIILRFFNPPDEKAIKRIWQCVNDVCGCSMEMDIRGRRGLFFKTKSLQCHGAVFSCPAVDQTVCGDNYAMFCAGRKRILCISDGMGNGPRAFLESDAVISLIRAFLHAGYDSKAMIRAINSLLMMREDETFATLDLCLMDMVTREAEFIKAGAAPSYLIRKGIVREINGASLPVGIVREMKPAVVSCSLERGDVIVMASDGIIDAMGHSLPGWLAKKPTDAEETAQGVFMQAQHMAAASMAKTVNGLPEAEPDDMTVMAVLLQ